MKHYVKNKDLREALIESKLNDKLTPAALDMIIMMVDRYSTKFSYEYPEDRDDCKSFAVMDCWQYWRGYDPAKSPNAFAYMTTVIRNGLAKGWRRLYKNFPKSKKISISQNNLYNI